MNSVKLEKILNGDISLINHEALISPDLGDVEIVVSPSHVKKMLRYFLDGKISVDQLKHWAEFVRFRDEYVCKDWAIDEIADYYTDMWEIVEMTSTPELDYELTPETIRRYLKVLEKYDD
jgi:hypothetical protein